MGHGVEREQAADGLAVGLILVRMEGAVAGVALGPDQQQQVFALRALVYCAGKLACHAAGLRSTSMITSPG